MFEQNNYASITNTDACTCLSKTTMKHSYKHIHDGGNALGIQVINALEKLLCSIVQPISTRVELERGQCPDHLAELLCVQHVQLRCQPGDEIVQQRLLWVAHAREGPDIRCHFGSVCMRNTVAKHAPYTNGHLVWLKSVNVGCHQLQRLLHGLFVLPVQEHKSARGQCLLCVYSSRTVERGDRGSAQPERCCRYQ